MVLTFGPDGAYGHPDHIAISQLTTAAIVAAADARHRDFDALEASAHAVSKLYFLAWPATTWAAYQFAFKTLTFTVDDVERQAVPWPDWAITTTLDTAHVVSAVERAVACHASQTSTYRRLWDLPAADMRALFGRQFFYRAFSRVNSGHRMEVDIFEGLRP